MKLVEKLIGKEYKPGAEEDYDTTTGVYRIPIKIESAVLSQNTNSVILNGDIVVPLSVALDIIKE